MRGDVGGISCKVEVVFIQRLFRKKFYRNNATTKLYAIFFFFSIALTK